MFSALRIAYNNKIENYKPIPSESGLNKILIEGSYMPWQIASKNTFDQKLVTADEHHVFHEAGHALARIYEGQESRLYDTEGMLKFVLAFDTPKDGWGKKAGLHEARAHAFTILLHEKIDPEYELVAAMYFNIGLITTGCAEIAHGYEEACTLGSQIFKDEIDKIKKEISPSQALIMWQDFCARSHKHQQTIDIDKTKMSDMINDLILFGAHNATS